MELIENLDIALFQAINGISGGPLDQLMIWLSDKYVWIPLYVYVLFRLYQKTGRDFWIPVLAIVLVITLSDQFTSSFMKPFFERLRPCKDPDLANVVNQVDRCGGRYGFASSHAANTMGLAFFLFLFEKRSTFTVTMLIWAFFVGFSRVYLGVHFPGDVVVGFVVGIVFAYSLFKLMVRFTNQDAEP